MGKIEHVVRWLLQHTIRYDPQVAHLNEFMNEFSESLMKDVVLTESLLQIEETSSCLGETVAQLSVTVFEWKLDYESPIIVLFRCGSEVVLTSSFLCSDLRMRWNFFQLRKLFNVKASCFR